jgi:hypothetical protein
MLGWSDGGITGMVAAGKFTANIDKLVVWGANAYINDKDMAMVEGVRDVSKVMNSKTCFVISSDILGKDSISQSVVLERIIWLTIS